MKTDDIKKVVVIGSGTMGSGIAQLSSMAGYKTVLYDINENALKKAEKTIIKNLDGGIQRGKITEEQKEKSLEQISYTDKEKKLTGDFFIEAIIENLDVKQSLFKTLEKQNEASAIFTTNTSSIPVTRIGSVLKHPERFAGMHFFNPAHIMKLVEVVSGAATNIEVATTVKSLAEKMGKTAVMAKDSPGFIVNRVARHFYVESLKIYEENVANFKSIDELLESSGFRMGPFKLMDLIGVETNFSVTTTMFNAFHQDGKFRPSRIQHQKVDAGHHGRKSGRGFYEYD